MALAQFKVTLQVTNKDATCKYNSTQGKREIRLKLTTVTTFCFCTDLNDTRHFYFILSQSVFKTLT